jgi:uncharacterized protein YkwD
LQNRGIIIILFLIIWSIAGWSQDNYYSNTNKNFRNSKSFNDTIDIKDPDLARLNAVIFYLTNEIRIKHNLKELKYEPLLEKSATIHSGNMVKQDFFDHINTKSTTFRTPDDRARFVGISNPFLAENIIESFMLQYKAGKQVYTGGKGIFKNKPNGEPIKAHTYLTLGESLLKDWMNSPHHRSNILSKDALQLGCGTAFFLKKDFNDMPSVMATQNFQLFESVKIIEK